MTDLLANGDTRPASRRLRRTGALALALAVGGAVLPGAVAGWRADRERSLLGSGVRLTGGDPVGSGSRLDGTVLVAWVITNSGPRPLHVRELRIVEGGLNGSYTPRSVDPLLPGASRQFEVPLSGTSCPDAIKRAPDARLEVLAETVDGTRRSVRLEPTYSADRQLFPDNALIDAARQACNRPSPVEAAKPRLTQLVVTGDSAGGMLVLGPTDRPVVLRRLLSTPGLVWSTPLSLPLRVPTGDAVRVPVTAQRGDCRGVLDVAGAGTIGVELQIESAPTDAYVEPPQVSYANPSDVVTSEDPLGSLRDELCGVSRA